MIITNEVIGELILLGINISCVGILCIFGFMFLKMNYKLRKQGIKDYQNSLYYSMILMLIWIFTSIPNLLYKHIITQFFKGSLEDGLPISHFIIVSITLVFISYALYQKIVRKRFHIQLKYSLLLVTVGAIYWCNRFDTTNEFFPVLGYEEFDSIKILDLPFALYSCCTIILLFHSLFQRKEQYLYREIIVSDKPLDSIDEDQFKRTSVYNSLIDSITNTALNHKKSLSIGIINKWGEGKTSFLKFIKKELNKDSQTVIVEFNPWYSNNTNNLTLDFFQTLDSRISEYIYTGSTIRKYAKSLTNVNSIYNPFKYLPDKWVGDKSNQQYFSDINKIIKRLGRRIVVIVDDLDRLDNKEVLGVFQVIRNSADFSNTLFIIPFDKDYVIKSLTENKIPKPSDYIKKMFDVELALPPIYKFHLSKIFESHFTTNLKKLTNLTLEDEKQLIYQINTVLSDSGSKFTSVPKYSILNKFLSTHLNNRRDIIRYTNSVLLALKDSHQILYLPDLLIIELIKYLNNDIYRKLFENRDYLISEIKKGSTLATNVLRPGRESEQKDKFPVEHILTETIFDYDIKIDTNGKRIAEAELIEELFNTPIADDFRWEYSMHFTHNHSNYHQLIEEGIAQEEIDDLFK